MSRHLGKIASAVVLAVVGLALFGPASLPLGGEKAVAQQAGDKMKGMDMRGKDMPGMKMQNAAPQPAKEVTKAICVIHPLGDSKVMGKVTFAKVTGGVEMKVEVSGLTPGEHGFHIHEWGDCSSPDGMSTGGHYNPTAAPHAGPDAAQRHAGDFGNITADASGKATLSRIDKVMELNGPNSIVGRAIVVHAGRDDLTSQPSGNAGGRIGCGVIGVANPAPPAPAGGSK
jgi:Cu-Zn family superoxide dismutase